MAITASVVAGLAVGWVCGMWARKRSNLWCPVDGSTLSCPQCLSEGAHLARTRRASTVEGEA